VRRGSVRASARLGAALALFAAVCASSPDHGPALSDGQYRMGTILEIELAPGTPDPHATLAELFAVAARLEAQMSSHDPASALSALNRAAGAGLTAVPPELARILADAAQLARRTRGAFDPSVGPLVALWAEAARRGRVPGDAEIAAARERVGAQRIVVGEGEAALPAGASVTLGGIAKGWALDRLGEVLASRDADAALLSFGRSSTFALGAPPGAPGWRLALRDSEGGLAGILTLRDRSLSVSESLGQWSDVGGRRQGHVLDPRSGRPLEHSALAAVVAPRGADAEAWSKALLVLGDEGLALLEAEPDAEGCLLGPGGALRATSGWQAATAFERLGP
jgi:thiamine biosynthesis lipoprotein